MISSAVILAGGLGVLSAQAAEDIALGPVTFDSNHTFQGPRGDIRFTVAGKTESQPKIYACLSWKLKERCEKSRALQMRQLGQQKTSEGEVYIVTIPRDFEYDSIFTSGAPLPSGVKWVPFLPVPLAELTIVADDSKWQVVREIGVTNQIHAALVAIIAVLAAGVILYRFAIYLGVPGPKRPIGFLGSLASLVRGYSVPLRLISTSNGWASLAQFQIILWTFVIGAGAVYVMTLTMSLITISIGTLALLGIAGTTTVLAEVKNNQESQASSTLVSPGKVTYLAPKGEPRETDIVVSWYPPVGSAAPITYLVQYLDPAFSGVWRTACRALRTTSLRIVGLLPGTDYQFRVVAANSAGMGPEETITVKTASTGQTISKSSITSLQAESDKTGTSIPLVWSALNGTTYVLEKRMHDSDAEWNTVALEEPCKPKTTVTNLIPNTTYDFRVRDVAVPEAWSPIGTFTTGVRIPKWSDLVTDTDRPAEIDVTRVQMLFFTVISAAFVALNILETGAIPGIDSTYITLMGISNGVYVTTKFVRV
jgi:hypothetical protein